MKNIGDSRSVLFSVSYQTFTTNLGESHEWLIVLLFCNKLIFWACEEGKGEEVTAFNVESTTRGGGRGGIPLVASTPLPKLRQCTIYGNTGRFLFHEGHTKSHIGNDTRAG